MPSTSHHAVLLGELLAHTEYLEASMAVGHSILAAAYHMLRDRVSYRISAQKHFDLLATDRLTHHYVHRLEQLGHRVT